MTFSECLQPLTPNQRAFLKSYIECASITKAAKCADVDRTAHYAWLNESDNYKAAFELAKPIAVDALESEAVRRAQEGCAKPVFYKGEVCGAITEYSDSLMQFLLKGAKPDTYKERTSTELSGGLAVSDPGRDKLSDEQLQKLITLAESGGNQ